MVLMIRSLWLSSARLLHYQLGLQCGLTLSI